MREQGQGGGKVRAYRNDPGEDAGKCTGDAGGAEEESLAVLGEVTRVPEGDVVCDSGV